MRAIMCPTSGPAPGRPAGRGLKDKQRQEESKPKLELRMAGFCGMGSSGQTSDQTGRVKNGDVCDDEEKCAFQPTKQRDCLPFAWRAGPDDGPAGICVDY